VITQDSDAVVTRSSARGGRRSEAGRPLTQQQFRGCRYGSHRSAVRRCALAAMRAPVRDRKKYIRRCVVRRRRGPQSPSPAEPGRRPCSGPMAAGHGAACPQTGGELAAPADIQRTCVHPFGDSRHLAKSCTTWSRQIERWLGVGKPEAPYVRLFGCAYDIILVRNSPGGGAVRLNITFCNKRNQTAVGMESGPRTPGGRRDDKPGGEGRTAAASWRHGRLSAVMAQGRERDARIAFSPTKHRPISRGAQRKTALNRTSEPSALCSREHTPAPHAAVPPRREEA
jgi:hypothetical protein